MAGKVYRAPVITEEDFNRQYGKSRQVDGQYYAKRGTKTDKIFHLFPKLPAELQLMVWKCAVNNLPVPKLQEFDFDFAYDPDTSPQGRAGNGLNACFKPKRSRQLAGHRAILMACVDSRKVFLDSGRYDMLPLTYLVGLVENSTKNISPKVKSLAHKATDDNSQANKAFVRVLLPVSLEDTRVLIDKVAAPFAYESVHPAAPPVREAFGSAAGLEFVHSIRRLAFSVHKDATWSRTACVFFEWFATSPDQRRRSFPGAPTYDLGALEELSYVSARAVERQGCIGEDQVWSGVPSIAVRTFARRHGTEGGWQVRDLFRLDSALMSKWARFHYEFNLRWGGDLRKKCTCRH